MNKKSYVSDYQSFVESNNDAALEKAKVMIDELMEFKSKSLMPMIKSGKMEIGVDSYTQFYTKSANGEVIKIKNPSIAIENYMGMSKSSLNFDKLTVDNLMEFAAEAKDVMKKKGNRKLGITAMNQFFCIVDDKEKKFNNPSDAVFMFLDI